MTVAWHPSDISGSTRRLTDDDAKLANKIRSLRIMRNVSQTDLGIAVGVTYQQIQKYECGKNRVSFGVLCKIAKALNVSVADFASDAHSGESLIANDEAGVLLAMVNRMKSPQQRRLLVKLARQLADGQ